MFSRSFTGNNVARTYSAMTPYPFVLAASLFAIQPAPVPQNELAIQTAEAVQVAELAETPRPQAEAQDQGRTSGSRDRGDNPTVGGACSAAIARAG